MAEFICAQTLVTSAAIVPEIKLHLATEVTPLWQVTEERLKQDGLPPPFWAFAWPGGQCIARYILDHPEVVQGQRVIDFAAGSGLAAIAAMKAGAKSVVAAEIDQLAFAAIQLNAELNQVFVNTCGEPDMTRAFKGVDLILAGDVCYQQAMSARLLRWLFLNVARGVRVLLADPGRAYVPQDGLREIARYHVPTSRDLEDSDNRTAVLYEMFIPS